MTDGRNGALTAGGQCGAVRFRAENLGRASICHCRMCRKAFGAFDDPGLAAPAVQVNPAEKLPFVETLHTLPVRPSELESAQFCAGIVSYQHPDHDTARWMPGGVR